MVTDQEHEALMRRVEQLEIQRQERSTTEAELQQLRYVADRAWMVAEAALQLHERVTQLERPWWRRLLRLPPAPPAGGAG